MSGSETDIQWFIARDGKQHGPVSDLELRKLVELSHLKATDLVWRQGFTDWRSAGSVFPATAGTPAPAPAPASAPSTSSPAAISPAAMSSAPAPSPAAAPAHEPAPAPASIAPQGLAPQQTASRFGTPHPAGPQSGSQPARETTAWRVPAEGRPNPLEARSGGGAPRPASAAPFPLGSPGPGPNPGPGPGPGQGPGPRIAPDGRSPADLASGRSRADAPKPRRSGTRRAIVVIALLAMAGAGAWLGNQYKDKLFASLQTAPAGDAGKTKANLGALPADSGPQGNPGVLQTAAAAPAPDPAAVDRKLQSRHVWVSIKQEFPDWYQARIAEVARLGSEQKSDTDITRYLVEQIVALRRENAKQALAASTARHKELAAAFLANLKQLSTEGGEGCYDFISKGETSPAIIAKMQDPAKSTEIETQVMAIVAAIAEGRKQPSEHAPPVKTDYDILAGELGRLGWTQADMQLFANPKELAKAPRERVCSMLKDWFTAHLAIQDPGTQERLLFETLKPVIAG